MYADKTAPLLWPFRKFYEVQKANNDLIQQIEKMLYEYIRASSTKRLISVVSYIRCLLFLSVYFWPSKSLRDDINEEWELEKKWT